MAISLCAASLGTALLLLAGAPPPPSLETTTPGTAAPRTAAPHPPPPPAPQQPAAPPDPTAVLRGLVGKDRVTVERRMGPPDETVSNGVQTFLRYHNFDSWRIGTRPDPFGSAQGFSPERTYRDRANFDCDTTLVLVDGVMRAYNRVGSGCR